MPPLEGSSGDVRLICSFLAIATSWALAGLVFCLVVSGPGTVSAWVIWGGGFCLLGWLLVGVPVVIAGDRILRVRPLILAFVVGFCGAVIVSFPYLVCVAAALFRRVGPVVGFAPSSTLVKFEGSAFLIGATAALLYRGLLIRFHPAAARRATPSGVTERANGAGG